MSHRREHAYLTNDIYEKPLPNIMADGKKLKMPLIGIRQGYLLLPLLLKIALEFLARQLDKEKK